MSRLYEAKVDENRWKIVETDNKNYHSYELIDKEKEENYYLNHIIGVEQVLEDEFLVYRRASEDYFEIVRCKLQNSKFYKLFDKQFNQFHFISDDRIIFTRCSTNGLHYFSGIYSIKENKILEESKWLDGTIVEIYGNEDDIKLYIEEMYLCNLNYTKLLFTVDPNTLQPNSDCYSQLRDSYIKVNSKEDIKNIILDEQKYIRIIEEEMYQKEREQLKKAKTKILVSENKI